MLLAMANAWPQEVSRIGDLLCAYSDLEVGMLQAVVEICGELDSPFKAMYRIRGEQQRIRVADGLARHKALAIDANLGNQFSIGIAAMQHCRTIRNQFAHCQWYGNASAASFVALETDAKENIKFKNFQSLRERRIDVPLLQKQKEYFEYVEQMWLWVIWEVRRIRSPEDYENLYALPTPLEKPDLYIHQARRIAP